MLNKKVSLITLQYVNNYGSVLQTFASQAYLEKFGFEVEVVNYTRNNYRYENLKSSMKSYYKQKSKILRIPFLADLLVKRWEMIYHKRNKVFNDFRNKNIKLSKEYNSVDELINQPPNADFYCVGSDQVWNYLYNDGVLPEYFLSYAPKNAIKFSLSSSFGFNEIDDETKEVEIKKYLKDFSLITVRENTGKQILDKMGLTKSHQILDPTLLISKEQWISMFNLKVPRNEDYVLVYQLNPSKEMNEFSQKIAKEKNCKLIVISNNIRMSIPNAEIIDNPTVNEFLELFLYAKCIITDSFHGTAFSLNFNRDFFSWMPNKYSTRLMSVLEKMELQNRAFLKDDDRWKMIEPINFDKVNEILNSSREYADFLIKGGLGIND